jgi:Putative transposase DNA-binding domain
MCTLACLLAAGLDPGIAGEGNCDEQAAWWVRVRMRARPDYKARLYGSQVVVANRWYPSSKTCSCCRVIKEGTKRGSEVDDRLLHDAF